ncbi:MAG: hypothetical protein CMJ34_11545 [Phycisphaerae bacterium]|nr:hypothetical protein [Phycisphaerae bacterium]
MLVGTGLLFSIIILLRNPILSRILGSELTRMTGGEVTVTDARFEGLTRVLIEGIDIRAPKWKGPSGDVIHVEKVVADLLPSTLLGMGFGFDRINVESARIRVAERHDDPTDINIASLGPEEEDSERDDDEDERDDESTGLEGLGSIVIDHLEIETGIARDDEWKLANIAVFRARIDAETSETGTHTFVLASVDDEASFDIATGTLDSRTGGFTLRTDDVDLSRGTSLALSASARAVVSAMEIGGTLRTANVTWTPGGLPSAELQIDDLAFNPPSFDGLESEWVRFADGRITDESPPLPRIELARGAIRLQGDMLEISGRGGRLDRATDPESLPDFDLAAVFRIELPGLVGELEDSSVTDWGDALLETAPFSLEVELDRFVRQGPAVDVPVDLPRVVASALELLTARSWDLAATAFIRREGGGPDAPDAPDGAAARIEAGAVLDLVDGVGMYEEFRYPLHDVKARLVVENELIRILRLEGSGPGGDLIRLEGEIDGTGDDAGVDLRLSSDSIALDDPLLAALPESTERGLRTLFDKEAARRLEAAELLPNKAWIAERQRLLPELRERLAGLEPDSREWSSVDSQIRRTEILVKQGLFELGGRGAIDLKIHRPRVLGHPVAVEGPIRLEGVGAIFSRFPYPLIVTRGEIILEDLAVIIAGRGLEIATTRGGTGFVSGRVDLPRDGRGGRDVHPTLELRVRDDNLSTCLLAAVPPELEGRPSAEAIPGWPGEVLAEAVKPVLAMGLVGRLDYVVRIRTDEEGDALFDVAGDLIDGRTLPHEDSRFGVDEADFLWPRGFSLSEVDANLTIDDDGVELVSFTGRRGEGGIRARGHYDFELERGRGIARLRNMDVGEYLLDLIAPGSQAEARRLWERWNPTGRFNADLGWSRRRSETGLDITAEPLWAEIDTTSGRTRLERERGRLRFHEGWLEIDGLAAELSTDDRLDAAVRLDGGYGYEEEGTHRRLSGVVDTAVFEAPVMEEVLRMTAGEAVADWWLDRAPRGRFDGRFGVGTGGGEAVDFDVDLLPTSFTLLSRVGDPASRGGGRVVGDGAVAIHDRRVEIGPVRLEAGNGAEARFELIVEDVEKPELAARFGLTLPHTDLPEAGFAPPPFSSVLETESVSGKSIELEGSALAVYWRPENAPEPEDPDIPRLYRASGVLDYDELTWDLGGSPVVIEPPRDGLALSLEALDGVPTDFDLRGDIPVIDVVGRPVLGVIARGRLATETESASPTFLITGEHGTIGRGEVRFDIEIEPTIDRYRFDATMADVDLDALETADQTTMTTVKKAGPTPGRLFARMSMEGRYDEPDSRVGHGRVTVRDASFAEGGTLALLQLGQLLPPIRDELAIASTELWIDGEEVLLEPIMLESDALTLEGSGRMRLDDWMWSLRLRPRGRVPGWSDLVSAISGTIAAIDVGGTPAEPVMEVVPLPILVPAEDLPAPAEPSDPPLPTTPSPENDS